MKLEVGTRIYNGGDMANIEHFGTITRVQKDRWGTSYWIMPDADSERTKEYSIPPVMVSPEYDGTGRTRIVTEAAYLAWREKQAARFRDHAQKAIGA